MKFGQRDIGFYALGDGASSAVCIVCIFGLVALVVFVFIREGCCRCPQASSLSHIQCLSCPLIVQFPVDTSPKLGKVIIQPSPPSGVYSSPRTSLCHQVLSSDLWRYSCQPLLILLLLLLFVDRCRSIRKSFVRKVP